MEFLVVGIAIKGYGQEFASRELPPSFYNVDIHMVKIGEGAEGLDCGHNSVYVLLLRVFVVSRVLSGIFFSIS